MQETSPRYHSLQGSTEGRKKQNKVTKLVGAIGEATAHTGLPKNCEAPAPAVGPPQPRQAGSQLTRKSAFHGAEGHPWASCGGTESSRRGHHGAGNVVSSQSIGFAFLLSVVLKKALLANGLHGKFISLLLTLCKTKQNKKERK